MHSPHNLRFAALAGTVIHDGDPRPQRVNDNFGIGGGLSVVQPQQDIYSAHPIIGTHQLKLLVLC